MVVGAVGFVIAAALWWSYFDVAAARGKDKLQDTDEAVDERHDLYGHLPMTLGITTAGVGLEELTLNSTADLPGREDG